MPAQGCNKGRLRGRPPCGGIGVRSQSPYHCNLMLAGWDASTGPSLYWMDYMATLSKVNTGGTGYGGFRRMRFDAGLAAALAC